MADIKAKYGTSNQTITITLNSLADAAARASTAVDNSSNCFLDAFVQVKVNNTEGAPTGDANLLVYAYGTADGGTTYSGAATGTDAAYGAVAGQMVENCPLLGIIHADADDEVFESHAMSVARAFGGVLPDHWGIIVVNQLGVALPASGHSAFYQGVYAQSS